MSETGEVLEIKPLTGSRLALWEKAKDSAGLDDDKLFALAVAVLNAHLKIRSKNGKVIAIYPPEVRTLPAELNYIAGHNRKLLLDQNMTRQFSILLPGELYQNFEES